MLHKADHDLIISQNVVSAMENKPGAVLAWTLPDALPSGTIFGVAAQASSSTNWTARVSAFELRLL